MSKKNNLSLVIPTYNRPRYLQRLLAYYDKQNVNYEIIVPDSSRDEIKEKNKKIISSFSNLKINHLDHFSSETNFFQKIAQTADFIKMKYSVLCADDDYITPKALDRSIGFLEKNPDFTVVGGHYIVFLPKLTRQDKKEFFWKMYLSSYGYTKTHLSLTSSNPKTRLINHLSSYFSTIYYLHRTSFIKTILKETLPYTEDFSFAESFGEMLAEMLTVIYGKIRTLNTFYGARESIPTTKATSSEYGGVIKTIKNGSFNSHYRRFRSCLIKHLSQEARVDLQTAKRAVDEGMNCYIQKYFWNYLYNSGSKELIRSVLRPIYYFKINLTQYQMLSFRKQTDLKHWNSCKPPLKYYEDFMNIQNSVLGEEQEEANHSLI